MGLRKATVFRRTPYRSAAVSLVMVTILVVASLDAASAGATRARTGTAVPVPTAASVVHPASAGSWWIPSLGSQPWQWELSNPLNLSDASAMGTNDKLPTGELAPAPVMYDIDGIINSASTVSSLHGLGKHVVCYIEVGAVGNYYTAANEGIAISYRDQLVAAGVVGGPVPGWPERYLDIRSPATLAIVESMIHDQCAAKGFDAVETDIDESYHSATGFGLTLADEEHFMTTLATFMHGLGLGWWIKNPDDTGDAYAADMRPLADAVLTEQCNQYSSCGLLSTYFGTKAIFNAEYQLRPSRFCAKDGAAGINGAQFNLNLTGVRKPCA
jgi:hypothetical protein